jgi:hypothetical protein
MFLNILFAVIKGMLELEGIQLDRKLPEASEPLVAPEKPCLSVTTAQSCTQN